MMQPISFIPAVPTLALFALLLAFVASPAHAQFDEEDLLNDTTEIVDTVFTGGDTLEISPLDTSFIPMDRSDLDLDLPSPDDFLSVRNGFFVGGSVSLTSLEPPDLDPILGGDLVFFGGEGYAILSGWMVGGAGVSAVLFDLDKRYDEFSFGYGGVVVGYEQMLAQRLFSLRLSGLLGLGGLDMIRTRPDLVNPDENFEILEVYRRERFFAFRPSLSFGYMPLPFLELRFGADYLLPVGGEKVDDLASWTYGVRVLLGGTF